MLFLISFFLGKKNQGPTEIRTRITGFRVLGANHYTMGPTGFLMQQDPAGLFTKSHSLFFFFKNQVEDSCEISCSCGRVVKATD